MTTDMDTGLNPRVVRPGEGLTHVLGLDHLEVVLSAQDTGGAVAAVRATSPPGGGLPPHVHRREDEVLLILEGEIEVWTQAGTVTARMGDVVFLPADVPHAHRNVSDRPARFVLIATPAGVEAFCAEFARLCEVPGGPDPAQAAMTGERHGVSFVPSTP